MLVKLKTLYGKIFNKTLITNEDQTDLSLGYTHISFDASIMPNGNVGIGMHDITNKIRKHSGGKVNGFSSAKGEMAALMFTLDYAKDRNLTRLNLYTDNLDLATKNNKKLFAKYNFIDVKLTWVPRELNTSADELSKKGQKVNNMVIPSFIGPSANQTNKVNKSKGSKITKMFKGYSYKQKVHLLSILAINNSNEAEVIRMLKANGVKDDYKFSPSNKNTNFLRMVKTLLIHDSETSDYVKKRLKSLKDCKTGKKLQLLSFEDFEKEFDERKPKNIQNIEKKVA